MRVEMEEEQRMTVHEHAVTKKLAKAAMMKERILLAAMPKYRRTVSFGMKATIPPAKRKAGTRQVRI